MICYVAKQMGQTGGKQIITLLTNDVQQRSKFLLTLTLTLTLIIKISRVTVNCFPFDVIVFAMLPAHNPLIAFGGKQFHC